MYLSHLIIKNYRSIEYLCVPFSKGKNVIVGKNNAGKSNIVKALNLVLGEKYPTFSDINENDFYCSGDEVSDYFWIICGLKGGDIDIEKIKDCKGFWVGCLKEEPIKRNSFNSEVEINFEHLFFDSDEYYSYDRSVSKSWKKSDSDKQLWAEERTQFDDEIFFIFYVHTDRDSNEVYVKDLRLFYKSNDQYYASWGLSKQMRDAFLTSAVVESFRETNRQLKINSFSWYGKLMKYIWEEGKNKKYPKSVANDKDKTVWEEVSAGFDSIRQVTNKVFEEISSDIQDKIDISFDNAMISFQFAMDNRADIHKNV